MDTDGRHEDEKKFTDDYAVQRLSLLPGDLRHRAVNSFEDLCEGIDYLRSAPSFFGDLSGKKALEMGCGDGWISLRLGGSGASVWACDISAKIIELAKRYAEAADLDIAFETMKCEEMTYEDDFFDIVFMHFALHHCDIAATAKQIKRVLKPGGKVILSEDYAYHPAFRIYRALTPGRHSKYERPLTDADISLFTSQFSSHSLEYSGLLNVFEGSNSRFIRPVRSALRKTDSFIYENLGFVNRYSRIVIIKAVK